LKRMYVDRINDNKAINESNLSCPNCQKLLGIRIIYKKESRPAYRLLTGTVSRQTIK